MADWKDTLNLPRTDFPMKANLNVAEPQALARWKEIGLYERIQNVESAVRSSFCTTALHTPTAASTSGQP